MDTIRVSVAKHSAILITRVFVCESRRIVKNSKQGYYEKKRRGCPTERIEEEKKGGNRMSLNETKCVSSEKNVNGQ